MLCRVTINPSPASLTDGVSHRNPVTFVVWRPSNLYPLNNKLSKERRGIAVYAAYPSLRRGAAFVVLYSTHNPQRPARQPRFIRTHPLFIFLYRNTHNSPVSVLLLCGCI